MMQTTLPRLTRARTIEPSSAAVDRHCSVSGGRPIRVALTVPGGFELGGIGRAMLYLTQAWSTMPGAPRWTLVDPRGQTAVRAPLCLFREACRLAALQSLGRLDLLHINLAGRSSTVRKLILSEIAAQISLPTIIHLHDFDYENDYLIRHCSMQSRVVRMFQRACLVLVLGRRDCETVITRIGCDSRRVLVVHNAVPDPGTPTVRRDSDAPLNILFLGHLDDRKGVPELLGALNAAELRPRSWRLTMAGGGEVRRFESEIRQRGLAERIELRGWVPHDEAYELMRHADIFVLPSHAEGMALSVLEAMAHGKAIITTPVGANAEAVRHNREALLVQPGSVSSLVGALSRMLHYPGLRASLASAARQRYLEKFEVRSYAARVASMYEVGLSYAGATISTIPIPSSSLGRGA